MRADGPTRGADATRLGGTTPRGTESGHLDLGHDPHRIRSRFPLHLLLRAALALSVAVLSLSTIELILRLADGLPLATLSISVPAPQLEPAPRLRDEIASDYAKRLVARPDVNPAWFDIEPEPPASPPQDSSAVWEPLLRAAREKGVELDFEHFKLQNLNFVLEHWDSFKSKFPGLVYVYDPGDGSSQPPYRFLPNARTPSELSVNAFGFRGRDIARNKPPRTIRVAFLGASTTIDTHSYPASYPELIEPWLTIWAKQRGFDASFEVINAGREGITSTDIKRVALDEVLPLEPDLLVYYEGSNQFSLWSLVPERNRNAPPVAAREEFGEVPTEPDWFIWARKYSAIARHLGVTRDRVAGSRLKEPFKPSGAVVWPRGVDEMAPDPDDPNLPLLLPTIVADLDSIRRGAASQGATLVPSTFVWLAWDGMELDPVRHRGIFNYLNSSLGRFLYRDIRRAADFQNRVFRAYAANRSLPLNDLAARMPMDPDLFDDPIHMGYPGVRLKAWLVFQNLLPILEQRILSGVLPQPDREWLEEHPSLARVRVGILSLEDPPGRRVAEARFGDLSRSVAGASLAVSEGRPAKLVTSARPFAYAYQGAVPAAAKQNGGMLRVRTRLRVLRGAIGVGVTNQKGNWIRFSNAHDEDWNDLDLLISPREREEIDETILTNGKGDGTASEAEIESIVFEEVVPPALEPLPVATNAVPQFEP
ncbi:MAG: hypothetical protein FJ148_12910 [Deltaproteobacteria bacterium]|nr:hypothetical protein [Deltaproteobacteria bacterium]